MKMQILEYEVRFLTPAFLGNAEQSGQWRTPPFKALLRQWWRVVYASDHEFRVDLGKMRWEEGKLFGNAWLSHLERGRQVTDYSRSLLRIRLDQWDEGRGTKTKWGKLELDPGSKVRHPEVKQPIGPLLYLGYGPLLSEKPTRVPGQARLASATVLKSNAAVQEGESARLSLSLPNEHASRVKSALWLMDRYGTLGGRSRNGWGSFSLTPLGDAPALDVSTRNFVQPWKDALKSDWPHALGEDEKGLLIWKTGPFHDWRALMRGLAIVKLGLRTQFVFTTQRNASFPESRHWLSYPVTNHNVASWNRYRLPNSLRFKVRKTADEKLEAVIFHVPCFPPRDFSPDRNAILKTWERVHRFLDELTVPAASRRYEMIADPQRLKDLKRGLTEVVLRRTPE